METPKYKKTNLKLKLSPKTDHLSVLVAHLSHTHHMTLNKMRQFDETKLFLILAKISNFTKKNVSNIHFLEILRELCEVASLVFPGLWLSHTTKTNIYKNLIEFSEISLLFC